MLLVQYDWYQCFSFGEVLQESLRKDVCDEIWHSTNTSYQAKYYYIYWHVVRSTGLISAYVVRYVLLRAFNFSAFQSKGAAKPKLTK